MPRLEHSDITKAEAFELGLLVGSAPINETDAKVAEALQSKILRKATDIVIMREVITGVLAAKLNSPIESGRVDRWIDEMKRIGSLKEADGKLVLQHPFIDVGERQSANNLTLMLRAFNGTVKGAQLAEAYSKSLAKGELRINEDGELELTEVYADLVKLHIILSSYGKNVKDGFEIAKSVYDLDEISKYGIIGQEFIQGISESLMSFKAKGLISIDKYGFIDVVAGKLSEFVQHIECMVKEEGFDLGEEDKIAIRMACKIISGDEEWWVP